MAEQHGLSTSQSVHYCSCKDAKMQVFENAQQLQHDGIFRWAPTVRDLDVDIRIHACQLDCTLSCLSPHRHQKNFKVEKILTEGWSGVLSAKQVLPSLHLAHL